MPDSVPYLQVDVEPAAGEVVVRVVGEIDAATAPQLAQSLRQAAEAGEAVSLDLAGVSFIDSSGLRVVTVAHASAQEHGRSFAVSDASAPVRKIFSMTGLDGLLAPG